jgi:hypothetical protein
MRVVPLPTTTTNPEATTAKRFDFGASVYGVDLNQLVAPPTTTTDVAAAAAAPRPQQLDVLRGAIVAALREHQFLHFPSQHAVTPAAEAALARLFDPAASSAWRDQRSNPWERYKAERLGGEAGRQTGRQTVNQSHSHSHRSPPTGGRGGGAAAQRPRCVACTQVLARSNYLSTQLRWR